MKYITYGVRELQENLGGALRAAQRGGKILITSRGKAVAMLTPPDAKVRGESAVDRKLRRMAAEGRVRLGCPGKILPFKPFHGGGVSAQVLKDRR